MTKGVEDAWKPADLEVTEMTNADFERRVAKHSIYESDSALGNVISGLAEHYGLTESAVVDRAIRVYVAYLNDEHDLGLRETYNVKWLIPPKGWEFDHPTVEYGDEQTYNRMRASTPPTVADMIEDILEKGIVEAENNNRFIIEAIYWFNSGST